jgi:transposase
MRQPLFVRATASQLKSMQKLYDHPDSPRTRTRVQMVLLSHDGYQIDEIAQITQQRDETVRRWLQRFLQEGCPGLREAPHSGRPPEITPTIEVFLRECIERRSPHDCGFVRATWTSAQLAQAIPQQFQRRVTPECIRQHLVQVEVVCRRPTWTVKPIAKQQPGYAPKKALLQGF